MDSVILPELPTYLFAPTLAGVLSLALTVLLPLVAALFMRQSWSAGPKGLVLLALAAAKAFLEAWLAATNSGAVFNGVEVGYAVFVNFGIAVAMYFGLLRDTGVQRAAISGGPVKDRTIDGEYTERTA
ncbi:hypothetical protein [Verrucosispora sp. NA02020]|uniref:hypothetical protein n=1 Tax=Verrucosispora sp. NA02020 TaxID=2742132 RepID=UPI001592127D|nr:hypothetical protein [Verrucosispora sp. NA02020]QKW15396.1 hypothetical protein HUT12_23265 [Verrucosispora sp. NA02020]